MYKTYEIVGYRELIEIYLESRRPQVHDILTDHIKKTVRSFEVTLDVQIPKSREDLPKEYAALWMLFSGSVESALALRTPTSNFLEGGLIYQNLESSGVKGAEVLEALHGISEKVTQAQSEHLEVLAGLLAIFHGGADRTCTIAEVRATGLYPGSTPPDFDMFDYM